MRSVVFLLSKYLLITILLVVTARCVHAQQTQRYNRFQYHKYSWKVYRTTSFNVFYPADVADSLYRFVAKEAPAAIDIIKKATLKEVPKNLNIVIYPSVDQLYESNIGSFEPQQFTLPTFVFKGSRVVLAYNGSYADLKYQLYEALTRALWETEMQEGGLDDQAKGADAAPSSKSASIPFWFKEGVIRYFAHGWTIAAEDKLRNTIHANHFASWQEVLSYEPRLAGHAFCYFLQQKFYPKAVAQVFFQLKKKKSLPRAARLITKTNIDSLYLQCYSYYRGRFGEQKKDTSPLASISIHHKRGIITQVLLSPDKSCVAYTCTYDGRRIIYTCNTKTKETKKIASYTLSPWIDDHSADVYPLVRWYKDSRQLFIVKPVKGRLSILRCTVDGNIQETVTLYGIDGVTSLQPLSQSEFLLSAYCKGQSDIVAYNGHKGKYTVYTDDEYDDAWPVLLNGSKEQKMLFISDRPKEQKARQYIVGYGFRPDTLWQGVYTIQGKEIAAIKTDTMSYIKWDKPLLMDDGGLLVTQTASGTEKNAVLNAQSGGITTLNNYQPFQYLPSSQEIVFAGTSADSIIITSQPVNQWISEHKQAGDSISPWLTDYRNKLAAQRKEDSILHAAKDTTHYFLDDVFTSHNNKQGKKDSSTHRAKAMHAPDNPTYYILQLQSAYFTAQVNNDYFINRYQPYANYQGQFEFPELGGMAQGGFTDILENHRFTITYRLPAATEGSDFYVKYDNLENKTDWGLSYFRKVEMLQPDPSRNWVDEHGNSYPQNAKVKTHYYEVHAHKPLSYDCSLGLQTAVRKDKTIFLSNDKYSLDFEPIQSTWSITTFSFDINKLYPTIPYLFKGFQADAHLDVFKGFTQQEATLFGSNINISYHQPLYRLITLVAQVHAGYSWGNEKVLYNLGGVDNNVTPRVDTTVHFLQNAPYAFQSLVTPFRGYYQNSLYGNQYTLLNADVYFPVFQTLFPLQTPLPAINNLQLGIFTDVATAKETWQTNPSGKWLSSYGFCARTTLAGYPLRVDVAWPGSFSKQPVVYFSLKL